MRAGRFDRRDGTDRRPVRAYGRDRLDTDDAALVGPLVGTAGREHRHRADRALRAPARPPGLAPGAGITGLIMLAVAVCSPIAGLARDGLLEFHMLQHTLIGGFGALLVLAALPRVTDPVEGTPARWVSHPLVGFPLWVISTAFWLTPGLHDQLLTSDVLWILQQLSFFVFGVLVWCPVFERFAPAPKWFGTGFKCGVHDRCVVLRPLHRQHLLVRGHAALPGSRRPGRGLGDRARCRIRPTQAP